MKIFGNLGKVGPVRQLESTAFSVDHQYQHIQKESLLYRSAGYINLEPIQHWN